jgi:hypothetical protein
MYRRVTLLISIVLGLGLVNDGLADITIWTNDGGDRNWCDGGNWNNGEPVRGDTAYFDQVTAGLAASVAM